MINRRIVYRISRWTTAIFFAASVASLGSASPASASASPELWFKQVGTDSSKRPASEPSGSLVREGTFNHLASASAALETLTVTCSTGTNPHWNAPFDPTEVIVDSTNNKLYWHNSFEPAVVMSNLDGSSCERIVQDNYYTAAGIALDSSATYLYTIYYNVIRKVDIAGKSNVDLTITGDSFTAGNGLRDLVIDGNFLYATTNTSATNSGRIVKVNLTTLVATNLITGQPKGMEQIALDTANNKIYWANKVAKTLSSANLSDGTNIQTIRTSSKEIRSVAIDTSNSKLYIGEMGAGAGVVVQTDLDGTNVVSTGYVTTTYLTISNTNSGSGGSGGSGGGTSSSSDSDAARKENERKRQEAIRNAQVEILRKVKSHIEVLKEDLKAADALIEGTSFVASVNIELAKLDSQTADFSKIDRVIKKYRLYDQIAGNNQEIVSARQLVEYGVINSDVPMKTLATWQLMKRPIEDRDSVEEINAYFAKSTAEYLARKEHLASTIAKIHSR